MTERPCDDCGKLVLRTKTHGPILRRCSTCSPVRKKQVKKDVARRSYLKNRERILEKTREYREENTEKWRESYRRAGAKWKAANPEKRAEASRRRNEKRRKRFHEDPVYRAEVRQRRRINRLASQYNVSEERYQAMLRDQNHGCAICGTQPREGTTLHVDHDHACCPERKRSCGKCVRGFLCQDCNHGLGNFRDDPEMLQKAIAYLES